MSYRWTEADVDALMRRALFRSAEVIRRGSDNIASITPVRGPASSKGTFSPRAGVSEPVYAIVGMCRAAGLPEPVPEYRFHARRWRFDYAWPCIFLALEIDGGVWANGRHSRGSGRILEMEKMSEAAIDGWRVIYATPDDVRSGAVMDRIQRALGAGPKEVA